MKKIYLFSLSFLAMHSIVFAQLKTKLTSPTTFTIQPIGYGDADMQSDDLTFLPSLYHTYPAPAEQEDEALEEMVIEKTKQKLANIANTIEEEAPKKTRVPAPTIGKSWKANTQSGTPPDNSMAVNTLGQIVSMVNSNIIIYTDLGVSVYNKSMVSFFKTNIVFGPATGTSSNQCDPKVIFDCESKRFIAFGMTCTGVNTSSRIMIAVSKEEDPTKGWYNYVFAGDPNNWEIWFDYPRLGVNGSDIFITGNMFNNNGTYADGVLYQIDKIACYAGNNNPKSLVTYGLGKFAFSITHANQGLCNAASPNIHYMVSSSSGANNENRLSLYTVTGKANDAAAPSITSEYITTNISYSAPGYAIQPNTSVLLKSGDSRMQDAMIVDGTIHCVFHCDASGGYNGIHYSRIKKNGSTWSCTSKKISASAKEYAYPAIASFANHSSGGSEQTAVISFLASSNTEFPNIKAVVVDETMTLGTPTTLKTGDNFVDYGRDTIASFVVTRWGDYMGIGRQHNTAFPTVWVSGMYGNAANTYDEWSNYIIKLVNGQNWATPINDVKPNATNSNIYPNPSPSQYWQMEIVTKETKDININLVDAQGKLIKELLKTNIVTGKNTFQFNTASLANGTYFVNITDGNETIETKQLIIQK
jgi:Secretion system C-terminal sorting domain